MNLTEQMTQLGRQAKEASRQLARLTTAQKNGCLLAMADALEQDREAIQEANADGHGGRRQSGLSNAMLDRLKLDDKRIAAMAKGLREVAALPDPVGRVLDDRTRPNGLRLQKISTPIGVIVIIYESRPNVTADAASLCFKSGNAAILRGGREAMHSNQAIAETMLQRGATASARISARTPSRSCRHGPRGGQGIVVADAIRRFVHAARRRRADSRRGRLLQGAGHQTLQGRLPRLCRCRGGLENGRGNRLQRQMPAARRLQRHGNVAGGSGRGGGVSAGHGPAVE